uniref:AAA_8 domain-containing protein n=1 Tax=Steinernema glaseri TaxID=37863 RepID=A0A1I8AN04_9BILA
FHYDYINAVCFVLPPNASRLENSLKYGISEVFANIDRRLAKNVLFCFTKCSSTFFKVGATVPTIKKHLEGIRHIYDLDVDGLLSPGNRFLFDNESIEYLCARIGGTDIGETQEDYERSYNKSYENAVQLLEKVAQMEPVVLEKESRTNEHMLKNLFHLCFKLFASTDSTSYQNEIVLIAADI